MKLFVLAALAAIIALGGCHAGPENVRNITVVDDTANDIAEANATANVAAADNVTAKVIAMNDRERNVVFIRAILDAGLPCDGVKSSERLDDRDGKPVWRAVCVGNGGSVLITITPDGIANIINRTDR